MAELKTRPNESSVAEFLARIPDDKKRRDSLTVVDIMRRVTGVDPTMWGPDIIGFGSYHFKYASGREGEWFLAGISPRKNNLTLYIMTGFERYETLLLSLGKHERGKSCLYIKSLEEIDLWTLEMLIMESVKYLKKAGT